MQLLRGGSQRQIVQIPAEPARETASASEGGDAANASGYEIFTRLLGVASGKARRSI